MLAEGNAAVWRGPAADPELDEIARRSLRRRQRPEAGQIGIPEIDGLLRCNGLPAKLIDSGLGDFGLHGGRAYSLDL